MKLSQDQVDLIVSLIDAKAERNIVAARIAMVELTGPEILTMMLPLENRIQGIINLLTTVE